MGNTTTAQEVIDFFESSFRDKVVLPVELEMLWLKKAIGRYSLELEPLEYDDNIGQFAYTIDTYVIDTLASFMRQYYQEREVSKVNKQISIVGKDLSIDGQGHGKTAAKNELEYYERLNHDLVFHQKPTAYS